MGIRAAATGEVLLEDVRVPASALVGDGDPAVYAECVRRARLAWCAVTVGTARAVLDYVIPYVNERVAFGEPISHRQSVAFAVADIAIELEGMRLATLRAATRADARQAVRPRRGDRAPRCASSTACGSATTACSCSAGTATSRSTRSSAGTATSRPSA